MAESIKVCVRFKGREQLTDEEAKMWTITENQIEVENIDGKGGMRDRKFTYDHILDSNVTQTKMYEMAGKSTVDQFTKGFNGTIFAYGMSGTGKTFSMLGPEEVVDVIKKGGEIEESIQQLYGIIPRAICDVFEFMNNAIEKEGCTFQLFMNYFEIYLESLNDLLNPDPKDSQGLRLNDHGVPHASNVAVTSPEDIFNNIQKGQMKV